MSQTESESKLKIKKIKKKEREPLLTSNQQAYTAIDSTAAPLVHAFFREAEMLWQGQGNVPSFPGIAACEIFSMGSYFYGRDSHALEALIQGRRMAEKMELLSIAQYSPTTISHFQQQSPKWLRAASHAAWGVHNWLSYVSFGVVTAASASFKTIANSQPVPMSSTTTASRSPIHPSSPPPEAATGTTRMNSRSSA